MRRSCYTLVELVAVILVIALITGIVVFRSNSIPAFISLEGTARNVQLLLARASLMATSQGRNVHVRLDASTGIFSIEGGAAEKELAAPGSLSYKLPPGVQVGEGRGADFSFYPDGTGSGTPIELSFKGQRLRIKISKLTGISTVERDK